MTDTIAAISTGQVLSGIGVLRLSGPEAIQVVERVFTPSHGAPMSARPDRLLVYGTLRSSAGDVLDVCLCTVSRAPHSYTGEDTAELQCHGSPTVLREGLEALFAAGARFWPWHVYSGWWLGAKAQYQEYNRGGIRSALTEEGDRVGAGLSAGYSYMLLPHLNLDFGLGVWGGYAWYTSYACPVCGLTTDRGGKGFILPSDLLLSLTYVF